MSTPQVKPAPGDEPRRERRFKLRTSAPSVVQAQRAVRRALDRLQEERRRRDRALPRLVVSHVTVRAEPLPTLSIEGVTVRAEPLPTLSIQGVTIRAEPLPTLSIQGVTVRAEPLPTLVVSAVRVSV